MFKITAMEKQFILAFREIQPFKDLANELEKSKQVDIVKKLGKPIGKGMGREVYLYNFHNKKFVVKRALNELGKDQNERQFDVYANNIFYNKKLLCPVYAISDDGKIIIMAYAKGLKQFNKAIKEKIGIKEVAISDKRFRFSKMELLADEKWDSLGNWEWGGEGNRATVYLDAKNNPPDTPSIGFGGDFIRPSSWGVLNNKIVLVDYGF
jgi:hypothetical protein